MIESSILLGLVQIISGRFMKECTTSNKGASASRFLFRLKSSGMKTLRQTY